MAAHPGETGDAPSASAPTTYPAAAYGCNLFKALGEVAPGAFSIPPNQTSYNEQKHLQFDSTHQAEKQCL